jgi:hypothetical protein
MTGPRFEIALPAVTPTSVTCLATERTGVATLPAGRVTVGALMLRRAWPAWIVAPLRRLAVELELPPAGALGAVPAR